jgi:DNA-binding MarR family transcriptional regulator
MTQAARSAKLPWRWRSASPVQPPAAWLTPAQHQLLLAIRGHSDSRGPTVGDVADSLLLRHHSAVGLVDRAAAAGLVERGPDPDSLSVVRLHLTRQGLGHLARTRCGTRSSTRTGPPTPPRARATDYRLWSSIAPGCHSPVRG